MLFPKRVNNHIIMQIVEDFRLTIETLNDNLKLRKELSNLTETSN